MRGLAGKVGFVPVLAGRHFSNVQGGPGSVRFGYSLGMEGFERFRFSVPAVPLQKGFVGASVQFHRKGRFRFWVRFLEDGSSGSAFGFGQNGSDGSGFRFRFRFLSHPVCFWRDRRLDHIEANFDQH